MHAPGVVVAESTIISGDSTTLRLADGKPIDAGNDEKTRWLQAMVVHDGVSFSAGETDAELPPESRISRERALWRPVIEKTLELSAVGNDRAANVRHYVKMWDCLLCAGVPTLTWVRTTDRETVLIPDLTARGGALYGKATLEAILGEDEVEKRRPHPMDQHFLTITDDFAALEEVVGRNVRSANRAELVLSALDNDAFELFVFPADGRIYYTLVVLDLSFVHMGSEAEVELGYVSQCNQDAGNSFLATIREIRTVLLANAAQQQPSSESS